MDEIKTKPVKAAGSVRGEKKSPASEVVLVASALLALLNTEPSREEIAR